jgi:hypothetical protein
MEALAFLWFWLQITPQYLREKTFPPAPPLRKRLSLMLGPYARACRKADRSTTRDAR